MTVRSLADLGASREGREWLAAHGVHTDPDRFRAVLKPPSDAGLATLVGVPADRPLIYVGQQVATDYSHATAAKFAATGDLSRDGLECVSIWHDMDRAGAERCGMRIVLHVGTRTVGFALANRKLEDREPRFIRLERAHLPEIVRQARDALGGLPRTARDPARVRLDRVAQAVADGEIETLAQATRAIATWLLREQIHVELPSICLSDLAGSGLLRARLLEVLERVDEVVAAFNGAVARLGREGIDARVHPLGERWLPLWYSCPMTDRRTRLVRDANGGDWVAVATCKCGNTHRFRLREAAGFEELEATGRWSPDVLLPVLTDSLASGYVAGRSTALYGIVMRAVIDALGREPTPSFVPPELATAHAAPQPDSILHDYLTA